MNTPPFNLSATIRATIAESTEPDPHKLADLVLARIAPRDRDDALAQALPTLVRASFRRQSTGFIPYGDDEPETDIPSPRGSPENSGGSVASSGRSRKVSGIREHWRSVLSQRIAVGERTYKLVEDCGVSDLEWAAASREDHAARTLHRAAQLRALAELLNEHRVETVGRLPEAILRVALPAETSST